ncbi:ABC-type glycerol-3-phosphate transport system substrate-binding protein [Anaerotaenia torta]|uniref:extracellular solute-binding protein n=1 Tax=Anaerotaenia torta TaxID=433293 RepID=UPI003D1DEC37
MNIKSYFRRMTAGVLILSAISYLGVPTHLNLTASPDRRAAQAASDKTREDFEEALNTYSIDASVPNYNSYIESHTGSYPQTEIEIAAADYSRYQEREAEAVPVIYTDYQGRKGDSLLTSEDALVEFDVKVKQSGFYYLSLEYYPIEGKSSDIQRSIFIDGELPYKELSLVEFSRLWTTEVSESHVDDNGVTVMNWQKDNQGNDLKPGGLEVPDWIRDYCYDSNGYITAPLAIYLTEGEHTISILSLREPMLIHKLTLGYMEEVRDYKTQKALWDQEGAAETKDRFIRIEAENAKVTSSQMLYPRQDQSSPAVYPSSPKLLLNNTIGDESWRDAGQWIEWEFEVEEAGYYNISMYAKQSYLRGIKVSRRIMIDGKVPFQEMEAYGFGYSSSWKDVVLSDEKGNAYQFYLKPGRHTIRMEVVLGEFASIIGEVKEAVGKLNAIYRKVIRIIGVKPDKYRDYQIEATLPGLEAELIDVRDQIADAIIELRALAGSGSEKEAVLRTMRDQLTYLIKDQEDFVKVITAYKINVRACGNWLTQVVVQPLALDRINIYSADKRAEYRQDSFFSKCAYEIKRLFYSFLINYNMIGNISEKDDESVTLTLWIGTGRDQANVIKSLIDDNFTGEEGINVNVQLVDMGTLLKAEMAGEGPDVAIQVGPTQVASTQVAANLISAANDTPVNYGIRNAVLDLTQFPDYQEVAGRFSESALVPFTFRDSVYALPDTQTFLMMFYRKDILSEIGMEVPRTWDEVKVAMTVLAKNQMEFGMYPGEQIFAMLLYQMGGDYYNADGTASALNSEVAVNAFKKYCEFYTDYKLDKETSAEERFRTGECPLIIADYTVYNNLQVSAPDIEGLWEFTTVPGIMQEDGTLNHTTGTIGLADIIMAGTKHPQESWTFLKWWTSAETQVLYGREMESLMGSSARVATANLEALARLAWPVEDYRALTAQFEQLKGIRQVPGGYYSWRNVNNAFYTVVTDTDTSTPREELMEKVIYINAEIEYKLAELGLTGTDGARKQDGDGK